MAWEYEVHDLLDAFGHPIVIHTYKWADGALTVIEAYVDDRRVYDLWWSACKRDDRGTLLLKSGDWTLVAALWMLFKTTYCPSRLAHLLQLASR